MSSICDRCSVVINDACTDGCEITESEYLCQFISLFRIGPLWECLLGPCCGAEQDKTKFRHLLEAIGRAIYKMRRNVCDLALESNPCTAECQDTLEQWAEIYGISHCLKQNGGTINLDKELICEFSKNRGIFNCDWIKLLAKLEGYEIIECEQDCSLCPAPFQPGLGFGRPFSAFGSECTTCEVLEDMIPKGGGFGPFALQPNRIIGEFNTECEREFANFPCLNCCQLLEEVGEFEPFDLSCDQAQRILGRCGNCGKRCPFGFGFISREFSTIKKLKNPSTLVLTIEGPPPCPAPFNAGNTFGRQFAGPETEFSLCLLESQVPAHICIRYNFSEEAC